MSVSMMVLIVLAAVLVLGKRRRRYRYWPPRRGMEPLAPPGESPWAQRHGAPGEAADLEGQMESLETRIARLEERLDFTERLLQGRVEKKEP